MTLSKTIKYLKSQNIGVNTNRARTQICFVYNEEVYTIEFTTHWKNTNFVLFRLETKYIITTKHVINSNLISELDIIDFLDKKLLGGK